MSLELLHKLMRRDGCYRHEIKRNRVSGLTILTYLSMLYVCDPEGKYETLIFAKRKIFEFEQYRTIEAAKAGHQRWVELCQNPNNQLRPYTPPE